MPVPSRYDAQEFPPYQFREYPKHVQHNGKIHTVANSREERELLGEMDVNKIAVATPNDRENLYDRADALNITYDKRANIEKLRKQVEDEEGRLGSAK